VIALFVPRDKAEAGAEAGWRSDLAVLTRPQVLLGLLMTVFSWIGVFAAFTYIAPLLTEVAGFSDSAVSPILLVLGAGLVAGNLLGGRFADRRLVPTLLGSLALLAVVLAAMTVGMHDRVAAVVFAGLLGAAAFATVPPLQIWILEKAAGAGQALASSLNIAAFNLGNAAGAALGGLVIDHGPGLGSVTLVAALAPLVALTVAFVSLRVERGSAAVEPAIECPPAR
jgi:DHA1 family inner membrane transport protein